jgi:hypothetical protein
MKECPKCRSEEPDEASVCSRCGNPLNQHAVQRDATRTLSGISPDDIMVSLEGVQPPPPQEQDKTDDDAQVSLFLVDHDQVYNLSGKEEYTIGRVTEGQAVLPDVDLSSYEAYAQGVSRQHATIKMLHSQVVVIDLNSSNGTRVNGQKIIPHVEYPVREGDIVALGKLRLQVIIP